MFEASTPSSATTLLELDDGQSYHVPNNFICPITLTIMTSPLVSRQGHCYERSAIFGWLNTGGSCPITRRALSPSDLIRNRALEYNIKLWREANGLPATPASCDGGEQVSKVVEEVMTSISLSVEKQSELIAEYTARNTELNTQADTTTINPVVGKLPWWRRRRTRRTKAS